MPTRGQIKAQSVWNMLAVCAPGFSYKAKPHNVWILYNGRTYRGLPKYQEIDVHHVRKMLRHLAVDMECARRHLPMLDN
jgi:hypothetical protein